MKTKLLWVVVAILFSVNNSSWAQGDYAGTKTVTNAGNVDLSEWILPSGQLPQVNLLKIVVERVEPQLINTGVNAWTVPNRTFPDNYPNYSNGVNTQWAPTSVPGSGKWRSSNEEGGNVINILLCM